MPVDPFAKAGLHRAEDVLKAHGVDAYHRSSAERTGDSHVIIDGRKVLMAGSNDYLGLSTHPRVIEAAVTALRRFGTTVSGSRVLNGTLDLHGELEARLAAHLGQEAAAVTTTGFGANLALAALLGRDDIAFGDARNHVSLAEGVRLGLGKTRTFRHRDLADLRSRLAAAPDGGGRLIITDSVFSMDGDVADLPALRSLADEYGAKLIVDAAHDMGVLDLTAGIRTDLITGSLSKSFASAGGVLAGPPAAAHPMLRLTLTANHDDSHLTTVLSAVDKAAHRLGTPRDRPLPPATLTVPHA